MKRLLAISALTTALLAPQAAQAKIVELGAGVPQAKVSCPENCQAVGRVTGYQGRGGNVATPFLIPRKGKIIAFTVRLGKPDANQVKFFDDLYGNDPQVQLTVLKRGKGKKNLEHTAVAQSPAFKVSEFFGSAPTFTLNKPLEVRAKYIVALTVPTWAPVFAVGLQRNHWWRSSRAKGKCDNVSQMAPLTKPNTMKLFSCTYFTARLYYTATYVPDNKPTVKPEATKAGSAKVGARTARGG